jgi:hypothetical protein
MNALSLKIDLIELPTIGDLCWAAACERGEPGFTMNELHAQVAVVSSVRPAVVRAWIEDMLHIGALVAVDRQTIKYRRRTLYAVPATRRGASAPETTRERIERHLWTAMRGLATFSTAELAAAASTDELRIDRHTAADYIRRLADAGAVIDARPRREGVNSGTWRLRKIADTGPLPPRVVKLKVLADANTGKPIGQAEATL